MNPVSCRQRRDEETAERNKEMAVKDEETAERNKEMAVKDEETAGRNKEMARAAPATGLPEPLIRELITLGVLFLAAAIAMKIVFFREHAAVTTVFTFSLFWLFVLPGYSIMHYWHDKLPFLERLVVGTGLAAAVLGIASYYLGLAGVHNAVHGYLLPAFFIVAGAGLSYQKYAHAIRKTQPGHEEGKKEK